MNVSKSLNNRLRTTLLGQSRWAIQAREQIARFAAVDASVLVAGPTGAGKELIARAIHEQSPRADNPFIPVCCTTITSQLFASQLFGHCKGAFTGAEHSAMGCFRAADGGTIFLDEIGELELEMQAKLLRVVQERAVVPVGSSASQPVDFRLVCATNRDLKQEVSAGRFREDLYFRINVVSMEAGRLKDRAEDIVVLAEHFLEQFASRSGFPRKRLSPGALELLTAYDWPGNVRELKHVLERAMIACDGDLMTLPHMQKMLAEIRLPAPWAGQRTFEQDAPTARSATVASAIEAWPPEAPASFEFDTTSVAEWKTLDAVERAHICSTLERVFYNQSAAARLLGISRQSLLRKVKAHRIELPLRSNPLDRQR